MSEGTNPGSFSGDVFPAPSEPGHRLDNLPLQLTSFVGREREMAEVEGCCGSSRLLTLTGPGGSGKTRLALAVASRLVDRFEDGVWLVELAPLSDPDLVPQAVASVLGVREAPGTPLVDSLRAHIGSRQLLLVLDNCEHLIGACASLAEALLRGCPNLRVLATSREALGRRRRDALRRPSPLVAGSPAPSRSREPALLRGGEALRRAGQGRQTRLRPDAAQRDGGGADLLPARRDTAGHRARRGQGEGALGGADL